MNRMTTEKDLSSIGEINGFIAYSKTEKRASNGSVIWKCRCTTCNSEIEIPSSKFIRGEFAKCSTCVDNEILNLKEINGMQIIAPDYSQSGKGRGRYYICKCSSCGREYSKRKDSIKSGVVGCKYCADKRNGERSTIDMTGKLCGRLRVICKDYERTESTGRTYWKCLCNCGNSHLISVRADSLRNGTIQSCGCYHKENVSKSKGIHYSDLRKNNPYGHLTALEPTEYSDGSCKIWKFRCDCDNHTELLMSTKRLKRLNNPNCGCVKETELVGNIYGYLKVVRKSVFIKDRQTTWDCICTRCGSYVYDVSRNTLISGGRISCGCLRNNYKDLTGMTFGHLKVIKEISRWNDTSSCAWLCQCDCGNTCEKSGGDLNDRSSCGCVGKSSWHSKWQGLFGPIREIVIGNHRPDYVFKDVVFEFQHSRISLSQIQSRNATYTSNGYKVVWVLDGTEWKKDELVEIYNERSTTMNEKCFSSKSSLINPFHLIDLNKGNIFLVIHRPNSLLVINNIETADLKRKGGKFFIHSFSEEFFDFSSQAAKKFVSSYIRNNS